VQLFSIAGSGLGLQNRPDTTREAGDAVMPLLRSTMIRPHRDGSGPAIVMLHGIAGSRRDWSGLAALAQNFQLLTYDLPGHGETPAPDEPYEIEDLSDQLAAILNEAGIDRAHLVGSSLGGMVAQCFASAHPERVDRLVLCDTSPGLSEGMRDEFLTMHAGSLAHAAMARADLMDLAEEIFAVTLVLCAEGAALAMREGADFLARSIPFGQLAFVPGAVADSVTERPDWVARVLLDFLG
jgi:pimeloyl-ACP methyl ester carboxylesterase